MRASNFPPLRPAARKVRQGRLFVVGQLKRANKESVYLKLQLVLVGRIGGLEEVAELLVVNLEVGEQGQVAHVRARGGGRLEEVLEGPLDEAAHRVGLTAARLPVSEHRPVVAIEDGLHDVGADLLVDDLGRGLGPEGRIELVYLTLARGLREAAGPGAAVHRHYVLQIHWLNFFLPIIVTISNNCPTIVITIIAAIIFIIIFIYIIIIIIIIIIEDFGCD
jgi:hypothetical protein